MKEKKISHCNNKMDLTDAEKLRRISKKPTCLFIPFLVLLENSQLIQAIVKALDNLDEQNYYS